MNTLFAEKRLLVLNKVVTTCSKLSRKPLNTTIIDNPYVVSGSLCRRFLFQNSLSK